MTKSLVLRWFATGGIVLLLALDLFLPRTMLGRRGAEAAIRADSSTAIARLGDPLPELSLIDLEGAPIRLADLHGHRVLITFERSVDW